MRFNRVFAPLTLAFGLAACGTAQRTDAFCMQTTGINLGIVGFNTSDYNQDCARGNLARTMVAPGQPATMQAAGVALERRQDPEVDQAVRRALTEAHRGVPMNCSVANVDRRSQRAQASCTPAPSVAP